MKVAIVAAAIVSLFTAFVAVGSSISGGGTAIAAPQEKVAICHMTHSARNPAVEIEVSGNAVGNSALEKHLKHGDFIIDEDNPFCPALEEADLTIEKVCVPDDFDDAFTINILDDAGDVVETVELECGGESEPITLEVGVAHTVVEEPVDGVAATYTGLCDGDGSLMFDGTAAEGTCVVTNTGGLTEVVLTVEKFCPTTLVGPFVIRVLDEDGITVGSASLMCGASSAPIVLAMGIYTVVETPPEGVGVAYTGECDGGGQLVVDGTEPMITCTVTNSVTGVPTP